jgi:hypothetical protein
MCLVATGYLVPTTASSVGDVAEFIDGVGGDVTGDRDVILRDGTGDGRTLYATPAAGPNGEFALIVDEDGVERLVLDFTATTAGGEGINPMARSTFDDVFVLVNEFEESETVRIELVDVAGASTMDSEEIRDIITFYARNDAGHEVGGSDSIDVPPESTASIGLEFDPVGSDLAGTSIEFAFVFVVPDRASGEPDDLLTADDRMTAGGGDARATDGPGVEAEPISNEDAESDAPILPGSGAEPMTTPSDPDGDNGPDAGVQPDLPIPLIALLLLSSLIIVGRGWRL